MMDSEEHNGSFRSWEMGDMKNEVTYAQGPIGP